jgi:hypothetical protein
MLNRQFCGATLDCMGANAGAMCPTGQVCNAGACGVNCPLGQIVCGGTCVDPSTDRMYCGAGNDCMGANAGTPCPAGQICQNSTCQTSCTAGQVVCGGACVDPMSSRQFCGAVGDCSGANAGAICGAGQVCTAGTCVAVPCPTGQIVCGGGCIDPATNPQFCGASGACMSTQAGAVCRFDQYCSAGRCSEAFGRYSYLSPGTNSGIDQTRARPTRYNIGTAFPATIFWTVDGSTPTPGTGSTRMSPSPLDLGPLNDGAHIRWFADFGPPNGPEPLIHELRFHVDASAIHSTGSIVESFRFMQGFGPVALAAPGATVTASVNFQYWKSDPNGYCPGCVQYFSVNIPALVPGGGCGTMADMAHPVCPICANNSAFWTGVSATGTLFTVTAPSVPGRYPVYAGSAADYHCDPGGEEIGEIFVY